jgi:hypothetical protein
VVSRSAWDAGRDHDFVVGARLGGY